jgi:hypothetical protein
VEVTREEELYKSAELFASARLAELLATRLGSDPPKVFAQQVSTAAGRVSGKWTRPDMAAVAILRGEFIPYWTAELHTFEIKTARGLDVTGVHEANSHARLGHFAWIAFQAVGRANEGGSCFDEVLRAALAVGVGVLTFTIPDDPTDWKVTAWPRPSGVDNAVADTFIRERFDPARQSRIRNYLAQLGWTNLAGASDGD